MSTSFLKDVSTTLVTRFVALALAFFTSIAAARLLGSAGMGEYTLIMTFSALLMLISGIGLESANVYMAGKGKCSIGVLFSNSVWIAIIVGGLVGLTAWTYKDLLLQSILKDVHLFPFSCALIALPFMLGRTFFQGILRGENKINEWNGSILVNASLLLPLLLFMVWFNKNSVMGAISAQLITAVIVSVGLGAFFVSRVRIPLHIDTNTLREGLNYGGKIQASNFINFFNYRLNFFLLNLFLTTHQVGQYAVAMALLQPLLMIPTAIQYVLFPKVSSLSKEESTRRMPRILRLTALLMVILFCVVWFISKPLVLICYGADYADAVLALQVLLPGALFLSMNTVLSGYNCGRGKPEISIVSSGMGLLITVSLGLILIPRLGLLGAAFTAFAAYTVIAAVEFLGYLRLSGNSAIASLCFQRVDIEYIVTRFRQIGRGP